MTKQKTDTDYRLLAKQHALEWIGGKIPGQTGQHTLWRCLICGHEWAVPYQYIQAGGGRCPKCIRAPEPPGFKWADCIAKRPRLKMPTNERETVFLFDLLADVWGWRFLYNAQLFPDAIIGNGTGYNLWAEFEYRARNFAAHHHDPKGCDLIICWLNNWPQAPVPVWSLRDTLINIGLIDVVYPVTWDVRPPW